MTKSAHGRKYATGHLAQDDRLVQVSKGVYASGAVLENEFTVNYSYDSMGRMLRRDNGSEVTTFVWDGWDLLSEETDSVVTTYLVPDGLVWSFSRGEEVFQVHTDALGSVRVVTDSEGDVVARFEFGAWGELLPGSFDSVGLALRFVGGLGVRTDLEAGLLYMRHRWYDAELQRFISRDPIGLRGGSNRYVYAKCNPTSKVDPRGLYAEVTRSQPDSDGIIDVTIILPIEYRGAGATNEVVQKLNRDIEKVWTRQVGKYRVKTVVTTPEPDCPDEKKNKVLLYPKNLDGRSHTGSRDSNWYSSRAGYSTSPAPHEAGHLMGLDDLYDYGSLQPLPGFEKNIMAGTPRQGVEEWQIEEIIQKNP